MFEYKEIDESYLKEIKEIYNDSNWMAYLKDDDKLIRALQNSLYFYGAFYKDKLVGFIRCVGDGEHVLVVQDLIVLKEYHKKGIGTYLFKYCWDKYINVRMFFVVTDINDEVNNKFYPSFNMKKLEKGDMISYFR